MLGNQLAAGTVVDSRYEIVELIGGGGMGVVYLAQDVQLARRVALKMMHSLQDATADDLARFEREGQVMSQLAHRNIAMVYRFGVAGRTPYIAMEFIKGKSLRSLLNDIDRLDGARTVRIMSQVADALAHAHKHQVIHRDLKPDNVLLVDEPEKDFVKIVDFGLARVMSAQNDDPAQEKQNAQKLTQTGTLIGSVQYMSPEQCMGGRADERSEIYSFGCVLYECLAGSPPFGAENPIALLHRHLNEEPSALSENISKSLPVGLTALLFKCLEKNPANRYQSMDDLSEDLRLVAENRGAEVRGGSNFGKQTKKRQALLKPVLKILATAFTISLFALAVYQPLLSNLVQAVSHYVPASSRTEFQVNCAQWLIETGRSKVADGLLIDTAPARRYLSRVRIMQATDPAVQAEALQLAKAYMLRSEIAYKEGRAADALSLSIIALQYCRMGTRDAGKTPNRTVQLVEQKNANLLERIRGKYVDASTSDYLVESGVALATYVSSIDPPFCDRWIPLLVERTNDRPTIGVFNDILGRSAVYQKKYDVALKHARIGQALAIPNTAYHRGSFLVEFMVYWDQNDWKNALRAVKSITAPKHVFPMYAMEDTIKIVDAEAHLGLLKEAIADGETALLTIPYPDEPGDVNHWWQHRAAVVRAISRCKLYLGEPVTVRDFERWFELSTRKSGQRDGLRHLFLHDLFLSERDTGRWEDALKHIDEFSKALSPSQHDDLDVAIGIARIDALMEGGKWEAAEHEYKRLSSASFSKMGLTLDALIDIRLRMLACTGNCAESRRLLNRLFDHKSAWFSNRVLDERQRDGRKEFLSMYVDYCDGKFDSARSHAEKASILLNPSDAGGWFESVQLLRGKWKPPLATKDKALSRHRENRDS